jgi:hypothetical protein
MTSKEGTSRSQHLHLEVLSVLRSADTGIDGAVVWVAAGEFDEADRHLGPRLLVVLGDEISSERLTSAVTVLLTSTADIFGVPPEIGGRIETFVTRNANTLLRHWRGEIDTRETLDLLEKV